MKHKVLWIGFGNFARRLFPFVLERPEVEAVSFYYPEKEKALERFGEQGRWDLEEALADAGTDVVFITTPNDEHTHFIRSALEAGKHVFVEKPITASYQEAINLLPLVRQSKTVVGVGHNKRREAAIRKAKELVDEGRIGKVVNIYVNNSKGIAFDIKRTNWRFKKERHREGPLLTVGIHLVEVLHYLVGPVDFVSAVVKNVSGRTEAPDSNAVLLHFKDGVCAFLESNYSTVSEDILNIYGTEGAIYINKGRLSLRSGRDKKRRPSPARAIELEPIDSLKEEIDEFFDAVADRRVSVETGVEEAINALAVIEACYRSSLERSSVEMKMLEKYF